MSEQRYDPPPHERFIDTPHERLAPGDLVVSVHEFYDPPRPPCSEHLAERVVYDPYCKLDGTAGRHMSDVPCPVLAVTFIEEAKGDVLLLLAQDGTTCGVVGYRWPCDYRKVQTLQRARGRLT